MKLTMTQQAIKSYLANESKRIEEANQDRAFEYVSAQSVLKARGLDDDEIDRGIVGGGNDGGYDGIYIFLNDVLVTGEDFENLSIERRSRVELHLIQAKNTLGIGEDLFLKWCDSFELLISGGESETKKYNSEILEAFSLIKNILFKSLENELEVKIYLWAVSLADVVHPNVQKSADRTRDKVKSLLPGNVQVEVKIVAAEQLYSLIDRKPDLRKTLRGTKEPLCPDGESAIMTVALEDYYRFITLDDGSLDKMLFEANIRDYQGNNLVNKSIESSLRGDKGIDFWWLNNGITIIADSITRGMQCDVCLENPRVVNGLQTSNTIFNYFSSRVINTVDGRKVLVKCIASSDQSVRSRVISATNKQTTIPSAYLRALDPIQLKIERYFSENGLHYDRRKSSCKNSGIKPKDIITIPYFGQCLIAVLLQQPDYSRARPAQILNDDDKYNTIFNDKISLASYLALGKISLRVRQLLKDCDVGKQVQNDTLFYVLLYICVEQSNKFSLTSDDLDRLHVPSQKEVESAFDCVYEIYRELGGTDKAAKSKKMVSALRNRLGY